MKVLMALPNISLIFLIKTIAYALINLINYNLFHDSVIKCFCSLFCSLSKHSWLQQKYKNNLKTQNTQKQDKTYDQKYLS
jgi:hypothetical protein